MRRRTGLDKASLGVLDLAARRRGYASFDDMTTVAIGLVGGGAALAALLYSRKAKADEIKKVEEKRAEAKNAILATVSSRANSYASSRAAGKAEREKKIAGAAAAAGAAIAAIPVPVVAQVVGGAVALGGKFLAPVIAGMKKVVNPASIFDQRERAVLEYWMRFGPTINDRFLANSDVETRAHKDGKGWGWTPEFERYRADPATTQQDWIDFLNALGAADNDAAIYAEVMRFHKAWGSPGLADWLPYPANQYLKYLPR